MSVSPLNSLMILAALFYDRWDLRLYALFVNSSLMLRRSVFVLSPASLLVYIAIDGMTE